MKKYEAPEMNISRFNVENIVTESANAVAADALANAGAPEGGSVGTIVKAYWDEMTF